MSENPDVDSETVVIVSGFVVDVESETNVDVDSGIVVDVESETNVDSRIVDDVDSGIVVDVDSGIVVDVLDVSETNIVDSVVKVEESV